jgi:hypothetical protein
MLNAFNQSGGVVDFLIVLGCARAATRCVKLMPEAFVVVRTTDATRWHMYLAVWMPLCAPIN